jgi:hypothetical protein
MADLFCQQHRYPISKMCHNNRLNSQVLNSGPSKHEAALHLISALSFTTLTVQSDLHTSHSPMLCNFPNVQTNCIHHMDNLHFTVHHCLLWTFFSQTSQIIRSTACADVLNFCIKEVRWKHLPFTGTDKIFRHSFATIYKFNFFVAGCIHLKLTA